MYLFWVLAMNQWLLVQSLIWTSGVFVLFIVFFFYRLLVVCVAAGDIKLSGTSWETPFRWTAAGTSWETPFRAAEDPQETS